MIESLVVGIALAVWIAFMAVGAWILNRMNLQVRRLKEAPTPRESYNVLADQHEATDLRVLGVQRQCTANEQSIEDLLVRIRSIQARTNQSARRADEIDLTKLADYIQTAKEEPEKAEAVAFDETTQQELDYR